MNKFFKSFVAFLIIATLSISLVSCGGDDDPVQEPAQSTYTIFYAALIPHDNLKVGTLEFTGYDPVQNKEHGYTLPDNYGNDWNQKGTESISNFIKATSLGAANEDSHFLRYIIAQNAKPGMKYSATAAYTLSKEKLEALDPSTKLNLGTVQLTPFLLSNTGSLGNINMSASFSTSSLTAEQVLSRFDYYSERYNKPKTIEGEIK